MSGGYQSGQLGRTVNPLSYDFAGSNPAPPTAVSEALVKEVSKVARDGVIHMCTFARLRRTKRE